MRRIIIVIFLILFSLNVKSQLNINYSVGYASYKMSKMKDLMNSSIQMAGGSLPAGAKLVDNFPAYITHDMDIGYQFGKNEAGLNFLFMTTGAKIAVADYSGSYAEKLITNGYRIGAFYRNHFHNIDIKNGNISFFAELSPALIIATMKTKGKIVIYMDNTGISEEAEEMKETKTGFSVQPLAGVRFKLYNHLLLTIGAGYDFEFGADLGNDYRMDFSGFRIKGGIGYMF